MSRLWSKLSELLEAIGRIGFRTRGPRSDVVVGEPQQTDALGSMEWTRYTSSEALFDAWSPVAGSPWEAFHCVTLFAAIDRIPPDRLGPAPPERFGGRLARPIPPPPWAEEDVWAIVDLPGHESVAVAAWLCASAGFQTVSTFDNWPHKDGLIKPEMSLAALLRYADLVRMARQELSDKAPPVWICDRTRLGTRRGRPKEFDNRYYMDDSVLPGPQLLKSAGIRRVVYVCPGPGQAELPDFSDLFSAAPATRFPAVRGGDPGRGDLARHRPCSSRRKPTSNDKVSCAPPTAASAAPCPSLRPVPGESPRVGRGRGGPGLPRHVFSASSCSMHLRMTCSPSFPCHFNSPYHQ